MVTSVSTTNVPIASDLLILILLIPRNDIIDLCMVHAKVTAHETDPTVIQAMTALKKTV